MNHQHKDIPWVESHYPNLMDHNNQVDPQNQESMDQDIQSLDHPGNKVEVVGEDEDEDEDGRVDEKECDDLFYSMFADPDPYQTFHFHFKTEETRSISIELKGQKQEIGQLLHSTGLTLWNASESLCHYMIQRHRHIIQGKRILEVRNLSGCV